MAAGEVAVRPRLEQDLTEHKRPAAQATAGGSRSLSPRKGGVTVPPVLVRLAQTGIKVVQLTTSVSEAVATLSQI